MYAARARLKPLIVDGHEPGGQLTLDVLKEELTKAGLAKFMLPERLEIVAGLPRNATGKILKRELVLELHSKHTSVTT